MSIYGWSMTVTPAALVSTGVSDRVPSGHKTVTCSIRDCRPCP